MTLNISKGQIWSFQTDRYTENSIIIHLIELLENGLTAVHTTVHNDVKLSENDTMSLGHIPFEIGAFKNSLKDYLGKSEFGHETFVEGYNYWKEAKGGVFTISVDEAIGVIVETNMNPDREMSE